MAHKYLDDNGLLYFWQKIKVTFLKVTDYVAPVQSDWDVSDNTSLAYIKNKPNIPSGVVVDSALSTTSENPVQNKVITNALGDKVPNTRTVNNKALSADITLTASDVSEPEKKRKIIGGEFIKVFAEEASKLKGISFLAQGTIYPDILESDGVKAHHNVGGLPEDMEFELVEPVRLLYKDEVRVVGDALGLPHAMVYRQPFPGPGLGVRCLGAITRDRLHALREADAILREEFDKCGLAKKVWQYFIAVPDFKSVGVKDGKRYEGWPAIIRAVNTTDAMSATIEEIPYAVLHRITNRITAEVDGINRVLLDLTPKPVGTIEWE